MIGFSFLSTYPPTRCGLATFTEALATAMATDGGPDSRIVRMMDDLAHPAAPAIHTRSSIVGELTSIDSADDAAIRDAAAILSRSSVAIVQHEYGIFGGRDGADVVRVLQHLTVPSIVVLHTVLDAPTAGQRAVLEQVAELATAIVVMTETARARLEQHYDVDAAKVSIIAHGVAAWATEAAQARPGERTVLTWGLIGPGKGIEHGIRAMAALADTHPALHYIVAGQTHPRVVADHGEAYRESLLALADELGVSDRVTIDGGYLDSAQLAARVNAADLVLLPYDSRNQVTSGVLVEAIAAGKPVVATAFPHAVELLVDGTGVVVEHENPEAIAEGIRTVVGWLGAPGRFHVQEPLAGTSWPEVALEYQALASTLVLQRVGMTA